MKRNPEIEARMPKWSPTGWIVGPDGTEYRLQREQFNGAQSGDLIYYAMVKRPGDSMFSDLTETQRPREKAVRVAVENIIRKQLAAK